MKTNDKILIPKYIAILQSTNKLSTIIDPKDGCYLPEMSPGLETNVVSIFSLEARQETLRKEQDETINSDWQDSINVFWEYGKYLKAFLDMVEIFQRMCNTYQDKFIIATHVIRRSYILYDPYIKAFTVQCQNCKNRKGINRLNARRRGA